MDRILITDLAVRCIIGVDDAERKERQDVLINLEIGADLSVPCRSDRFEDTVDYRAVKKEIVRMVDGSHYHLVEALAESIADLCLGFPGVLEVRVRVDKPGALRFARSAGVEIVRVRRG
ncbi:MAG: dihydroneopterin aldolase [Nitrospiraceae bacterium]|nr:dihydroneopterin aldolase [Nitrospiraceae bacterium]